jgi:hypothetical protein
MRDTIMQKALAVALLYVVAAGPAGAAEPVQKSPDAIMHCLIPRASFMVTDFGAKGDGITDDTAAIQKAFDAAKPNNIIVIPAGRYAVSKTLVLTQSDVVVTGDHATLLARSPDEQALRITGTNVAIVGLHLQGAGTARLTNPSSAKILAEGDHIQIIGNSINGGASVGIMALGAHDFLIKDNTIENTLADAIHMTRSAAHGIVTGNTIHNSSDDMIAVVSYTKNPPAPADSDIFITHNNLLGNTWGRGITVSGGDHITIDNNAITNVNMAAGIYIAQETSYNTMDVDDVLVQNNTLTNISVPPWAHDKPAHHAALTIYGGTEGIVQYILLKDNRVDNAYFGGIRFQGNVCHVGVSGNRFDRISGEPLQINESNCVPQENSCSENALADGMAVTHPDCIGKAPPAVTGSRYLSYQQDRRDSWSACLDYR